VGELTYTTVVKFWGGFERSFLLSLRLHLFGQKYSKKNYFNIQFIRVMAKLNIAAINPVFCVTWSCRNHCI